MAGVTVGGWGWYSSGGRDGGIDEEVGVEVVVLVVMVPGVVFHGA